VTVAAAELTVSEVFGPTFQGEGPSTGQIAMFVRLGRCNLDCRWCDTAFTWDWSRFDPAVELHRRTVAELLVELDRINAPLLVVTGGEPLLQQQGLEPLLAAAG
jgi:7-carboxy-7-deazaguanine synthase